MPPSIPSLFGGRDALARGATQRALLWGLVVAGLAVLTLHEVMLAAIGAPPSTGTLVAANLGAGACFGLLGVLIIRRVSASALSPTQALWLPLITGVLSLVLAAVLTALTGGPAALDPALGLPATMTGALQVVGISVLEALVAFVLLGALRTLILFKRTKSSERNWHALLAVMGAAALSLVATGPLEQPTDSILHVLLIVGAVIVMVANAFRLSWIVYLSFRQKLATLGLLLGLLVLSTVLLSQRSDNALDLAYSATFSQPLSQFVMLTFAFGVLYASTALLALLFHLPTAGALQQKSGEMEALQALARLSGEVFDRDRLVDTIARAPVESGVAEAAWLALVAPESGSLRPRLAATHGLTPSQLKALVDVESLADDALSNRRPVLLRHAPADHRVRARPGDGVGSLLVLPLRLHERNLGALFATRAISEGFEDDDVAALETFGVQAALALSNADLFVERLERERLQGELAIAREVQRQLLPQRLPHTERLTCSALSLPAEEIAGDYYDLITLGPNRYGVIVADVAGKGTRAAFHMAELKGIFQAAARSVEGPAAFLGKANAALADSLHRSAFITAIYAVLDAGTGTLTLARAGHCPALLAHADGTVCTLRPVGLGLGLDRGTLFSRSLQEQTVRLAPGDSVVLYTDGIVEARGRHGDEYGYERLVEALGRHHALPPDALRSALIGELEEFAGRKGSAKEEAWEDDLTLVILKWAGSPVPPTVSARRTPALHADASVA